MNQTNYLYADRISEQLQKNQQDLEGWAKRKASRKVRVNQLQQEHEAFRKLVNRAVAQPGIKIED
ncbi:MAG: hypothetical protein IK127_08150 [Clostridia bacterium]|nr:hypothetical protein [Clostridia bacterium]